MRFGPGDDPRHREINEITAGSILKQLDAVLGEGWWK